MWYAARDVAFENPVTEDQRALMLERMGIAPPGSGGKIDVGRHAGRRPRQPEVARRRRLRPRVVDRPHGAAAAHRDLGLPHVRLGRGAAGRPRPGRRRRRGCPARVVHPRRRDAARRLPADGPVRAARSLRRRRERPQASPAPTWSATRGTGRSPCRSGRTGRRRSRPRGARCATRSAIVRAPPTSWRGSTSSARSAGRATAPGSRWGPRPDREPDAGPARSASALDIRVADATRIVRPRNLRPWTTPRAASR